MIRLTPHDPATVKAPAESPAGANDKGSPEMNAMTDIAKSTVSYEFGTFAERLDHFCRLLDVEPPAIEYEDGKPLLTEPLWEWVKQTKANENWLFTGCTGELLREWVKMRSREREITEVIEKLEPELQNGMLALMKAVIKHNLPLEEPLQIFDQVVADWRASKST